MENRIKALRKAAGLSQDELAEMAHIRTATLSEIENGKGNPRLSTLGVIADALQVAVPDLFLDGALAQDTVETARKLASLRPEERHAVETLLGLSGRFSSQD